MVRSMSSLLKLITIVVACLLSWANGANRAYGELLKRDNVTLKAPIIATPSQHWEGVDGTWSTFEIRVGTPASTYRVLPATSWQETWVVYGAAAGVCNASVGVKSDCQDARGGVFDSAKSDTWAQGGQNFLGLNEALGYEGVGQYGFDTVGLGYTNDTGPTLPHQIVSEIVADDWYFGLFGLGFQPTNFSGYGNPQASFTDTLYTNGTISSMSWSYTAGAYYRLKGIFGSLIFGGYDKSRFTPNNLIFTMTSDNLRDIVVTIRSITSTTTSGETALMSTPEFAFIDSSVPELWLPQSVCDTFAKQFNLTLDVTTLLYLLDNTTHASLLALNPNITITLSNQKTTGSTVDLVLPYSAFDLSVSPPILANRTSYYFPIRATTDPTQYTLGRTFLQEVYVTTHYNSRTFNVSQAIFSDSLSPEIIALPAILPTSATDTNNTSSSPPNNGTKKDKPLSAGAIAGIVIGVLILLAILALLTFFLLRRRKQKQKAQALAHRHDGAVEIDTGKRVDPTSQTAYAGQASKLTSEVDGKDARVEKWGVPIMVPQELEAGVVAGSTTRGQAGAGEMRDDAAVGSSGAGGVGGVGGAVLPPIHEHSKTPMAELSALEGGLAQPLVPIKNTTRITNPDPPSPSSPTQDEDTIISPISDGTGTYASRPWRISTVSGVAGGGARMRGAGGEGDGEGSPTVSEATWNSNKDNSPKTPTSSSIQRRGSRFEERFDVGDHGHRDGEV